VREAVAFVDAAYQPFAAEHAVIDAVLIDAVAKAGGLNVHVSPPCLYKIVHVCSRTVRKVLWVGVDCRFTVRSRQDLVVGQFE
jgi:hypothetical protein